MSTFLRKLADTTSVRHHHSNEYSEEPPGATAGPAVAAAVGHGGSSSWRVLRRHQPVCAISRRRCFWWARWLFLPLILLGVTAKVVLQQQSSSGTARTHTSRTNLLSLRSNGPLKDANKNTNSNTNTKLDAVGRGGGKTDNCGGDGDDDEEKGSGPRVAVCFFGLTRSLRWTLPSVQERLLGVLKEAGMRVDIFVHTYDLVEVSRTAEQQLNTQPYRYTRGIICDMQQPTGAIMSLILLLWSMHYSSTAVWEMGVTIGPWGVASYVICGNSMPGAHCPVGTDFQNLVTDAVSHQARGVSTYQYVQRVDFETSRRDPATEHSVLQQFVQSYVKIGLNGACCLSRREKKP